ncbi:MAG: hypothetical protein KIT27_12185 [Legionellales bacterium]|nr:hypothetical protein [Legionellales bacterium]
MSDKKRNLKPLVIALSAGLALGVASMATAATSSSASPFQGKQLNSGYNVADAHDAAAPATDAKTAAPAADAKDAHQAGDHEKCDPKKCDKDGKCAKGKCAKGKCAGAKTSE